MLLSFLSLAPDDYEPINTTLTFDSDTVRIVIPVRIVNDEIDEEDEQLLSRLQLEPVEGDLPNIQVDPSQASLTIEDDDSKKWGTLTLHVVLVRTISCRSHNWCRNSNLHRQRRKRQR